MWLQNATNAGLLCSLTLPGPIGRAYNTDRICIPEKSQVTQLYLRDRATLA